MNLLRFALPLLVAAPALSHAQPAPPSPRIEALPPDTLGPLTALSAPGASWSKHSIPETMPLIDTAPSTTNRMAVDRAWS